MGIGEFALGVITGLVANTIDHTVSYTALEFFQRRRIERRVEDAVAEVVEPLLPFLANEHIKEYQQKLLIQACVDELKPLALQSETLFQASLNGQKIYENLYADKDLPEEVTDEGLKNIYILLFPRIATLLCKIPAAVKDWENQAWTENYRKLDEITAELRALFRKVDNLASNTANEADELLQTARLSLAQKVAIELDLTGLRAEKPLSGKFDDFFVHPQITTNIRWGDRMNAQKVYETEEEIFSVIFNSSNRVSAIGVAGAGKSTWSKSLQRRTLNNNWQGIAIRVELRNFAQRDLISFQQLIRETVGKHLAEELTAARINQWIKKQQVIFILDGFDEIPPEKRNVIQEWIKELDVAVKNCPIMLTSRPLTTDHLDNLGKRWKSWNIEPFDKDRIIDYIQRWYQHTTLLPDSDREIDAEALASKWQSDPTIKPLTSNPLLLSTLLMVNHLDGSLPSGRAELYNRYVKGMLGLWDDRRKVNAHKISLSLNQKWQILRRIALYMHFQQKDQLDEGEISQQLKKILKEMKLTCSAEDVLETLRERSGLIIGPGIYSFIHKSVGEYLVAEGIVQGDQRDETGKRIDRLTLFDHRDDDRWNTVIFLWAGIASVQDLEDFIDSCVKVQSFSLAYGLLHDQHDKISWKFYCDLMNNLFNYLPSFYYHHGLYSFDFPTRFYVKNQSRIDDLIDIDVCDIRCISRKNPNVFLLIKKGVEEDIILWSDFKKISQTNIYSYIWIQSLYFCLNKYNHWNDFLLLDFPNDYNEKFYTAVIYQVVTENFVRNSQTKKADSILEKTIQFYCDFHYMIVIGLISNIVKTIKAKLLIRRIDKVIEKLLSIDLKDIESNDIQCTLLWSYYPYSDTDDSEQYDILSEFIKYIEHLLETSSINHDGQGDKILKYANRLVEIRDQN